VCATLCFPLLYTDGFETLVTGLGSAGQ
jgi:hypothetical protein